MKHERLLNEPQRLFSPNDAVPILLEQAAMNHGWDAPRSARALVELQLQDIDVRERVSSLLTSLEGLLSRAAESGFLKKGERADQHWLAVLPEDLRFSLPPERGLELALREHVELLERKLMAWDDFKGRLSRHEKQLSRKLAGRADVQARKLVAGSREETVRQYLWRLSPGPYESLKRRRDLQPYQPLVPYGGKEYVQQSSVERRNVLAWTAAVNHAYRLEQLSNKAVRRRLPPAEAEAQIKKWWDGRYQRLCSNEAGRSRFHRLQKIQERLGMNFEKISPEQSPTIQTVSRATFSGKPVGQLDLDSPMSVENQARLKEYRRVVAESQTLRDAKRESLLGEIAQAESELLQIEEKLAGIEDSKAKYAGEIAAIQRYMRMETAAPHQQFYRACIGQVEQAREASNLERSELSGVGRREARKRLEALKESLRRTELPPDGWEDLGLKSTMLVRPTEPWVSHPDYAELPLPEPKLYEPRFDENIDEIQAVCDRISALSGHLQLFSQFEEISKVGDPRLWPKAGTEVEIAGKALTVRTLSDGHCVLRWEISSAETNDLWNTHEREKGNGPAQKADWLTLVDPDAPGVIEIAIGEPALSRFERFNDFAGRVRDFYLQHREAACSNPFQHEFFRGLQRLGKIRAIENMSICAPPDSSVAVRNLELADGAVLRQIVASGSGVVIRLRGENVLLNDISLQGVSLDVSLGNARWENCVSDAATFVRGSFGQSFFDADSALSWDMTAADMRGIQAENTQAVFEGARFRLGMLNPTLIGEISGLKLSPEELAEADRARNQSIGRKQLAALVPELFPNGQSQRHTYGQRADANAPGSGLPTRVEVVFRRDASSSAQQFSLSVRSAREEAPCQLAQRFVMPPTAGAEGRDHREIASLRPQYGDPISYQQAVFSLLDLRYEGIFRLHSTPPESVEQRQGFMADVLVPTDPQIWVIQASRS